MKKRKKHKEKYYLNWKRITATTLIAALSVTSVSLDSLAAEPTQTAENQAKTESASDADDSVERPKELKGVTEEDRLKTILKNYKKYAGKNPIHRIKF